MPVLRKNEVRDMSGAELKDKINDMQEELMSERAKIASGGLPDNPGKLRELKKSIARIKTMAREKGYRIDG